MPAEPSALEQSTTSGGERIRWVTAPEASDRPRPTVLYCHGAGADSRQFTRLGAWRELRGWLIRNGWMWIECTGGGRFGWGNTASRQAYEAAVSIVGERAPLGPIVVLGRSMGGIVAHWLLTRSEVVAPLCSGAIINSGVQDLLAAYRSGLWTSSLEDAYGVRGERAFALATEGHDPMRFDPSRWSGTRVLQLVATQDDLVPPEAHGCALRRRYAGHPAQDELDVRRGGDHSRENGSYLQTPAMIRFLSGSTSDPGRNI